MNEAEEEQAWAAYDAALARWEARLEQAWDPRRWARGQQLRAERGVLSLKVWPGELRAWVRGSGKQPYQVVGSLPTLSEDAGRHLLELPAGHELGPRDLDRLAQATVTQLGGRLGEQLLAQAFPIPGENLDLYCSCPDPDPRCKHQAAVLGTWLRVLAEMPLFWARWRAPEGLVDPVLGEVPRQGLEVELMTLRMGGELGDPGEEQILAQLLGPRRIVGELEEDDEDEDWLGPDLVDPDEEDPEPGDLAGMARTLLADPFDPTDDEAGDPFWRGRPAAMIQALEVWGAAPEPGEELLADFPGREQKLGKRRLGEVLEELHRELRGRDRGA